MNELDWAAQLAPYVAGAGTVVAYNARKAFGRLFTAMTDWGVGKIEARTSENKALAEARVTITAATAQKIATVLEVRPEYVHAAHEKVLEQLLGKQRNLDKIGAVAARELNATLLAENASHSEANLNPKQEPEAAADRPQGPEISDDWLNTFEQEGRERSTEEMQSLFGKILAGEIRKPSSYSIRTLKLLGQMDQHVAALFQRVCSMSISLWAGADHVFDARVPSLGGMAAKNSLGEFGLGFQQCNLLQEAGLIIADYHSYMSYEPAIAVSNQVSHPMRHAGSLWAFVPRLPERSPLQVHGVALSSSGRELLRVVRIEANDKYTEALKAYFEGVHYDLVPVQVR